MSREYSEEKIKQALKAAGGNAARARQQIIAQALEDTKLLQELVAPHITGIVAHAVNRVMTMKEKPKPVAVPAEAPKAKTGAKNDAFGMEILKAIALGNPTQFGQESGVPIKRQAASQRHIDAIRAMVSKDKSDK